MLETGIVAESLLPKLQEYFWMPVGDILFLAARRYNALESRLDIEYTFVQHGVRDTRPASSRIYTVAEIRRLGAEVGLETVFDPRIGRWRAVPGLGSACLILVVEKSRA